MEEQKRYDKTITFTKLAKWVFGAYCMPKIMRDVDKDNPISRDIHNLVSRRKEETAERKQAYWIWNDNKTEKNATAYLNEIADEINFLLFKAGKVAGYKHMRRE